MNFLKRLFGVGSDNNDSKDDDRRREERRPKPSATPESKPQRSEAERERSQRPSRRRSNNPDERRNQQRSKHSDNERKPRRNNETGEESRSRGRSGDNNRRGRRPADRRGERRSRIEERPRATELSEYVLSTAEVVHDEERDKWRSLDFRKLDTVIPERTLAQVRRAAAEADPETIIAVVAAPQTAEASGGVVSRRDPAPPSSQSMY